MINNLKTLWARFWQRIGPKPLSKPKARPPTIAERLASVDWADLTPWDASSKTNPIQTGYFNPPAFIDQYRIDNPEPIETRTMAQVLKDTEILMQFCEHGLVFSEEFMSNVPHANMAVTEQEGQMHALKYLLTQISKVERQSLQGDDLVITNEKGKTHKIKTQRIKRHYDQETMENSIPKSPRRATACEARALRAKLAKLQMPEDTKEV